jgi:hypothetical protein
MWRVTVDTGNASQQQGANPQHKKATESMTKIACCQLVIQALTFIFSYFIPVLSHALGFQ